MFGLKIGGLKKPRTANDVRRDLNNAAATNLRKPSKANYERVEALRKEWNSFGKKKK